MSAYTSATPIADAAALLAEHSGYASYIAAAQLSAALLHAHSIVYTAVLRQCRANGKHPAQISDASVFKRWEALTCIALIIRRGALPDSDPAGALALAREYQRLADAEAASVVWDYDSSVSNPDDSDTITEQQQEGGGWVRG